MYHVLILMCLTFDLCCVLFLTTTLNFLLILPNREALVEDESGSLQASVTDIVNRAKRRHLLDKIGNVRLGMVSRNKAFLFTSPSGMSVH